MKRHLKKTVAILLCVVTLLTLIPTLTTSAANQTYINRLPDSYQAAEGSFTLRSTARLFVVSNGEPNEDLSQTAKLISELLYQAGYPSYTALPMVWGAENCVRSGDLVLKLTNGIAADGYRLEINKDCLTILASDTDGLIYGTNTLIRYFRVNGGCTLSCATISDAPDTQERTLMLDCARKYWSVSWIENLIRQMSWMGYNALELHITEDQGMHMNIWSDGPDCNGNDFSWLPGYKATNWASASPDPNGGNNYSADQIREIVALAQKYHIEVIPSVDVPCHCDYMIYQYRTYVASKGTFQFNYGGNTYTSPAADQFYISDSDWGNSDWTTVNINNTEAKYFTLAIIEAYADFFGDLGCNKMNIGCDEIHGTVDYNVFLNYVNETCAMLKNKGYSVRAFNDYLDGGSNVSLDKDLEICFWTSSTDERAKTYINEGRKVYNCIGNYCYYVLRQSGDGKDARDPENYWWSFHHSTEDRIYNEWNPSRTYAYSVSLTPTTNVSGGYFLIWGDWAGWNTEDQVWNGIDSSGTYNLIDRMWSNSVKMWNWDQNSALSYSEFASLRESLGDFPGYNGGYANSFATDDITDGAVYAFRSVANRSYGMTVENSSMAENANICVRRYQDAAADQFYIISSSEAGYYFIRSALSGKNLDIANDGTVNLTNVRQATARDTASQKWRIVKNADGTYSFFGKTSGKALDVNGAAPGNNVNVQIYESNGTVAQKWVLEQIEVPVITKAPDPTALLALLNTSYNEAAFTTASWQDYVAAKAAAQAVYDNIFSTQEQLDQAAESLQQAMDSLSYKTMGVYYKTLVGDQEIIVRELSLQGGNFSFSLATPIGYKFLYVESPARFEPYTVSASSGLIKGYATAGQDVVIWLENAPNLSFLEALLEEDVSGFESNAQYTAVYAEAKAFYDRVKSDPANLTYQAEIDRQEVALRTAMQLLTKPTEETKIITLETPTRVAKGKTAVIRLTTSTDVTSVSVEGVTLRNLYCVLTTDADGNEVKYWTFRFTVSQDATYSLHAEGAETLTREFSIRCS
ncbi:MAG: RICIN domain-containing protein [Oscillospiraceae bacterium]|nr:RICIN domain-containing protein [Oscillospiraceae bacterium]